MLVDVALMPELAGDWRKPVCIVVDVLRASSTIVSLLEQGARRVFPVKKVSQARLLAGKLNCVLMGERKGLPLPGFDFGNSPSDLRHLDFSNQDVVITTSNGTAALQRLSKAEAVLMGCVRNATACCQQAFALARRHRTFIGVVCSGQNGGFALDDGVCAGFLVETLAGLQGSNCDLSDAALAMGRLYRSFDNFLSAFKESASGRRIIELGQEEDLAFCARPDASRVVPLLTPEGFLHKSSPND